MKTRILAALTAGVLLVVPSASRARETGGATVRVSTAPSGAEPGFGSASAPGISADGNFIVFTSEVDNLVPGDGNGMPDVFLFDRLGGNLQRLSKAADGGDADGGSYGPVISADGSSVAFTSYASNLLPGGNPRNGVFVRDLLSMATELVSRDSEGAPATGAGPLSISSDGSVVLFISEWLTPHERYYYADLYAYDRTRRAVELVSVGQNGSDAEGDVYFPAMSPDGRTVAFLSADWNIAPFPRGPATAMVLHDRLARTTHRVTAADDDPMRYVVYSPPSFSGDGNEIAFAGLAGEDQWGSVFYQGPIIFNRRTGRFDRVLDGRTPDSAEAARDVVLSSDGRILAFASASPDLVPGDTNDAEDVFVLDRRTGRLGRASITDEGAQGQRWATSRTPALTADGRMVALLSSADLQPRGQQEQWPGWLHVFLHDRASCDSGAREDGVASEPLHDRAEHSLGEAEPAAHQVSCELAARDL